MKLRVQGRIVMDYGYLTLQATFDKDLHLFHSFQLNILARERKPEKQRIFFKDDIKSFLVGPVIHS